jgi:hypothetical protein
MDVKQIRAWVKVQSEAKAFDTEQIDEVAQGLFRMCQWYEGKPASFGHFLTAVLSNDFVKAVNRADLTNRASLPIYARFLYNEFPADYKEKWMAQMAAGAKKVLVELDLSKFDEAIGPGQIRQVQVVYDNVGEGASWTETAPHKIVGAR